MSTKYNRSLTAARKLIESRKAALTGFVKRKGLAERFLQLDLTELPEDESRHTKEYVGAIVEFAAQHAQGHGSCGPDSDHESKLHNDPRAFATHFLSKRPEYSRTAEGLAASRLEAWLMEASGYLFSRFVETVLEKSGKFVAIFEGKLNPEETKRMRTGTAPFMEFKPLIEAGQNNGEEIFEFTIFDCTASKKAKEDLDPQLTPQPMGDKGNVTLPGASGQRFESLLPETQEDYEAVHASGGIQSNALLIVLGEDALDTLVEGPDGKRIVDANGVVWLSEDGRTWLPDADTLTEAYEEYSKPSQEPRNYQPWERSGDKPGHCGNCRYFRVKSMRSPDEPEDAYCHLFAYKVERAMTCDAWEASQEGLAEDTRTVTSDFGTWALHEGEGHTIVAIDERAWMLPQSFDALIETITEVGHSYDPELSAERDLMVEATLTDLAETMGVLCGRPDELVENQRGERDGVVDQRNAERLDEAALDVPPIVRELAERVGLSEARAQWLASGEQITEQYSDVATDSERWHHLRLGLFKTTVRCLVEADDEKKDKEGDAKK